MKKLQEYLNWENGTLIEFYLINNKENTFINGITYYVSITDIDCSHTEVITFENGNYLDSFVQFKNLVNENLFL